ncbi:hypothetical protein B0T26DRAFT_673216 [Lasiosphaeria miniovina]|uniref:Uncharacterized protein n=1 Tax=Lasiosphaeria miniovina TaxID=1954250 RepID=A0AA40EAW1_9PEZI|nr:uncharacterized protein B0T26DRAFT_673216 [Lasiosphaeria miniovina]KAK0728733.1 hypothetical protein B0T26DRAFT_673216 [Lasiosphaeria miniovina]
MPLLREPVEKVLGFSFLKLMWSDFVKGTIEQFPIDSGILTTRNIYPQSAADAPDWLPSPQDIGPLIAHVKNITPPAERIHHRDSDHFTKPPQLTDYARKHLSPVPISALNWLMHLATCTRTSVEQMIEIGDWQGCLLMSNVMENVDKGKMSMAEMKVLFCLITKRLRAIRERLDPDPWGTPIAPIVISFHNGRVRVVQAYVVPPTAVDPYPVMPRVNLIIYLDMEYSKMIGSDQETWQNWSRVLAWCLFRPANVEGYTEWRAANEMRAAATKDSNATAIIEGGADGAPIQVPEKWVDHDGGLLRSWFRGAVSAARPATDWLERHL